jgi:hypothetical protein
MGERGSGGRTVRGMTCLPFTLVLCEMEEVIRQLDVNVDKYNLAVTMHVSGGGMCVLGV